MKMNNRGQFSIIAALLVTVILVSTIVAVYSTIRYDSSQNQSPQVLTATDEINSALYKALGFTVGYYGSILQVTGNSTYAKSNSTVYMNSALQYISTMNPAWGASVNLTSLNLNTNWFMNSSLSSGQLSVMYNLAGLGIYGVSYTTACSLSVQTFTSPSNNQVSLNVTQDGTQPLIGLSQQNFNFFTYNYTTQTWQLVSPTVTPTVYTNGTYVISVPSGIDTSAYLVQVTDSRGVLVEVSSYNRYSIGFSINPTNQTLYAHQETTSISGTYYNKLLTISADNSSQTLIASMASSRSLFAKFAYSLQGLSTIPANMWTMYYRAWQDQPTNIAFDNNGSGTTNAVSYVPITINNGQSSATPNPFQEKITWNPSSYTSYEASDLGNIRFYSDSALTQPLFAWLESCTPSLSNGATNATAWVKLTSPIAANGGTLTIYMAFLSTATPYDGNYWGDAPNLSGTYGAYDNGANVFNAYFNGNTATSSFSVYTGDTLTKATGISGPGGTTINAIKVTGSTGSHVSAFSFSKTMSNTALIAESSFCLAGNTGDETGAVGLVDNAAVASIRNGISADMGYNSDYFNQAYEVAGTVTMPVNEAGTSTTSWLYASATYPGSAGSSWSAYIAPQLYSSTGGYSNTVANNPLSSATSLYLGQISGSAAISVYYNFMRARANPPSNVMPSASLGTLSSASTQTISWTHTTGSGANRIMIVGVSIKSSTVSVSSVSYGAQNLVFIRNDTNSNGIRSELWYLTAPNSGTATVTVNLTNSANATGGSATYTGVSQTSPIDSNNGGTGASSSPSSSLTVSTSNSFLVSNVAINGSATISAEGSGQTPRWDQSAANIVRGHGSEEGPDGTGPQMMSWTLSGSAVWAVSTVAFKPVTSAAGYVDIDILVRASDNSIRATLATSVAASGTLQSSPTTLTGTYSWSAYNVVSQSDYLEVDYYVHTTVTGSSNAYLSVDNQTSALADQTRITNVNIQSSQFALQSSPVIVELMQNGTIRWLGQSLQNTTQIRPIPPIPVKAFHLTLAGSTTDLPLQVEDWASQYQIPLGLTSNLTVFSNNQMIVFPVSSATPQITMWWNGSDVATQPSSAYTNTYFTGDNPGAGTLTNGYMTLTVGNFQITSTVGSVTSTANFMRVDNTTRTYGSTAAYVIHHGIVRDIIQQEAEWSNGVTGCPNMYSQIVITLPVNSTYFTYQSRFIFINSAQSRTITDLSSIYVSFSSGSAPCQTENGVSSGVPIVSNTVGNFYNTGGTNWTPHHWTQIASSGIGTGIMFTDLFNQQLYLFDNNAQFGTTGQTTGALSAGTTLSVVPITSQATVSFTSPLDATWSGAIATWNTAATPIYSPGSTPTGLWLLAEYPPSVTITATT